MFIVASPAPPLVHDMVLRVIMVLKMVSCGLGLDLGAFKSWDLADRYIGCDQDSSSMQLTIQWCMQTSMLKVVAKCGKQDSWDCSWTYHK